MRVKSLLIPTLVAVVVAVVALVVRQRPVTHTATASTTRTGHLTIPISGYAFIPKAVTVKAGTRVSFTNHDATAHTATADNGKFDTGTVAPHATRTIDFGHPGTYTYHCAFHAFMTATITVKR